jgi:release factor glutamine methyltransferase
VPVEPWRIKDLLQVTTRYLEEKGVEAPRLNAEVLLGHQLDLDRVALYLNFDQPLTEEELAGYRMLIRRRASREPLQYITGVQEFWSLQMSVDPRVLIPRPETEIVVDQVIHLAKDLEKTKGGGLHIVELGTGCGAIAIALAKELPGATLLATDISKAALQVALENARTHGVSDRITFTGGDLWDPLAEGGVRCDLVVSNPPYVSKGELSVLPPEVRDHEPVEALDGGEEGMDFLGGIIRLAPRFLNPGGWVALEMSPHQTQKALDLIDEAGDYFHKERVKDYSGQYRVIKARKNFETSPETS